MKRKVIYLFYIMIFSLLLSSCEKKINSNIYYSTQFLEQFKLEEVDESDVAKIPLSYDLFYRIENDGKDIVFYKNDSSYTETVNGKVINDLVIFDGKILAIVKNDENYIYSFEDKTYTKIDFDEKNYINLTLYVSNERLYLILSNEESTKILELSDEFNVTQKYNAPLNTTGGVSFLFFYDDYFVIQNNKYEYYTNSIKTQTSLNIDNKLTVFEDEIFTICHEKCFGHLSGCEDHYYKNYLFSNILSEDDIYYHTDPAQLIYQASYNNIYYFLLCDCFMMKKNTLETGYYFIRYDVSAKKYSVSELNMENHIKGFEQRYNQIELKIEQNDEIIVRNYYIK